MTDMRVTWVTNAVQAKHAYLTAKTPREAQAAYHEILLFGGVDMNLNAYGWRPTVVRWLRRVACWLDR